MYVLGFLLGKQKPLQILKAGRVLTQGIRGLYNHRKDCTTTGQGSYSLSLQNENMGWEGSQYWLFMHLSR